MREQRLVFGEVAELYDNARAGYPQELIDDVIAFAGADGPALLAFEVGAGTGKATVSFAARGLEIVAVEPSPTMAEVARRNLGRFPNVRLVETSFEDWTGPEAGTFGLLYSGTAWHWVSPEARCQKAAEVLAPGGAIAVFWHRTRWHGEPFRDELEELYQRLAPDLLAQEPSFPGLTTANTGEMAADEIRESGLFRDETTRDYQWAAVFTADTYTDLLLTQSSHRMYPEEPRARLLGAVREVIAEHGGAVTVPFTSLLALARRA
jgi:SAM-dependent methyltransferase